MTENSKNISISLPGEWALQKTLGPVLAEIGDDLKRVYAKGRDKVIDKAFRKIKNPEDGWSANLRVAHDVFTSGVFTDDEICAEYFGGILASSRSKDGRNDDAIHLLNTIKSLSSGQLYLHYIIYNSLNKLVQGRSESLNVGDSSSMQGVRVWFGRLELEELDVRYDTDFNILHQMGVIESYQTSYHKISDCHLFPYACATPTSYGVLLYAVAHNLLFKWRSFSKEFFPDFDGVVLPQKYALSLPELIRMDDLSSRSYALMPLGQSY